ncbi:MAG: SET domain-containing protein [Chitinophagaceae bacterium]
MILPFLVIAPSPLGGRGVFTTEAIEEDVTIEISPVLLFNAEERKNLEATLLYNYIFEWNEPANHVALGLGYLSMYNHQYQANCRYDMNYDNQTMQITTVKKILPGDELFINYNGTADDTTPVWFDANKNI